MSKLADFRPLKGITLPGLGDLSCSGLTVVVGPNSSGKTQLLRDISMRVTGEPRELVVAADVAVEAPPQDQLLQCLKDEGFLVSTWTDAGEEQLVSRTSYAGSGQGAPNVGVRQLQSWRAKAKSGPKGRTKDEYLSWTSKFLVAALFLENRLTALKPVGVIDFEHQAPGNDIHAFHLNDEARAALAAETIRAFDKPVWSCAAKGNQVCLRVTDAGDVPSAEDRHSIAKMARYRTIDTEGDGMKSYVFTAISLLLGRRPVTIIDEPELCLHPPQALNLGQFIGRTAASDTHATFVATHSSEVLRGIISTSSDLQIVRVVRGPSGFMAKRVSAEELALALKKPTVRADTVLDGIFSQAVAIVEADGDRVVYQAAWEAVGGERSFDIHFATGGGTGALSDTANLYRVLGIPVSVIADLDVLADWKKVQQVVCSLRGASHGMEEVIDSARAIAGKLRDLPPTITEAEASEQLASLAKKENNWSDGDDRRLSSELSKLRSRLNGMRALKRGGLSALPDDFKNDCKRLVDDLARIGFFLVPVGELEEWLACAAITASKQKKWAWANEAAEFLRSSDPQTNDVWAFMDQVGSFLMEQYNEEARPNGAGERRQVEEPEVDASQQIGPADRPAGGG